MFYQKTDQGLKLYLHAIPRTSENSIVGVQDNGEGGLFLKIKTTAIAEGGKANKAIYKLLSKAWDVKPSDMCIIAGERSRKKTLLIKGDCEVLLSKIASMS